VNAIATTRAQMPDGTIIEYRDTDETHVRRAHFAAMTEGRPLKFEVVADDGTVFGVDLTTGQLYAGAEIHTPDRPLADLRVIYYKQMSADMSMDTGVSGARMEYFCVGWQATVDGRNVRAGLRVYPDRYEVTGAI
jgi:hypothetical protein